MKITTPSHTFKTKIKDKKDPKKFSSALEKTPFGKIIDGAIKDEKKIERSMKRLARGKNMSQGELLKMQGLLYQYTQSVDLASKVVEKSAAGLKQLMNIQV